MKPGYKQTEAGVIPEDWEVKPLGDIIKLQGGYSFRSENFSDIGTPVIRISDIQGGVVNVDNAICHPTFKINEDFVVKNGDLLVAMSGATTGKVGVFRSQKPAYQNQRVGRFVVRDENCTSPGFIGQLVGSVQFGSQLRALLEQGAQPNISGKQIESLAFPIPNDLPEQRAIAEALSDVDGLLGGLDRLIAKKRDLKQAAMQQLLTGHTRLPGFHGEWEVKRLGDILKVRHGKSQHGITTSGGKYPILASGGEIGRTDTYLYDRPSVLIGRKGTIDSPQYVNTPFWTVDTLFFTEIGSEADAKFVFYKFTMIRWRSYNEASGVPSLNAKTIENIEIALPPLPEQTAIAQILSDMDAELTALEQRREKTRALKQAMMQELLTGRTRLV